jgi:cell wall-associated NlpC family hydrolase
MRSHSFRRRAPIRHPFVLLLCLVLLAGGGWLVVRAVPVITTDMAARFAPAAPIELPAGLMLQLQAGDLIFRIGSSWQSDVVRDMGNNGSYSTGDPYSHVGMLVGNSSHWQVLHAVPAELPERTDAVVLDDLDFFLSPEHASGVAIYQVTADASAHAIAVENAMKRLGTPFKLVENDPDGQYCTTLVWYAWQRAGVPLDARFDKLHVPFATGQYLLPHRLRAAPELRLLFETPTSG